MATTESGLISSSAGGASASGEQPVDGLQRTVRVSVAELVEGLLDLRDTGMGRRVRG